MRLVIPSVDGSARAGSAVGDAIVDPARSAVRVVAHLPYVPGGSDGAGSGDRGRRDG